VAATGSSWVLRLVLVGTVVLLLLPLTSGSLGGTVATTPRPTLPSSPHAPRGSAPFAPALVGGVRSSNPTPAVTAAYDWDPQPLNLFGPFPVDEVGGLGAVMAASDPLRTGVMFGGQGVHGLTNLTITFSQTTGLWDTRPVSGAPSPRANLSFATLPGGKLAVAFGGVVNLTTGQSDNGTFVYDFQNRSWTNRSAAIAPPPREGAAFAVD
jgi:hypothetical protein